MQKPLSVTLSLNEEQMEKMRRFYDALSQPNGTGSIYSCIKLEEVTVTLYQKNKKGLYTALFQGNGALEEARIWDKNASFNETKGKEKPVLPMQSKIILNRYPQIGSDEVGTGDFFGPIIVVASFVKQEDVDHLIELGVTDSKKMNDDYILSIGPELIHRYDYSELALTNEKYNEIHDTYNMNAIKAKMHNQALLNLAKRHPDAKIYQDQFAEEGLYYSYLRNEKEVVRNITFKTKGESSFVSVALASVIARYAFLRKMRKMSESYQMSIPFGAGPKVDEFAASFVQKYGKKELSKVAKLNFGNAKKLL